MAYVKCLMNVSASLKPKVPTMTSDTTPEGVCFASSVYDVNNAFKAFDGDDATSWYGATNLTSNIFVGYIFKTPQNVEKVKVIMDDLYVSAVRFKIQGSNDTTNGTDGTWIDISSESTNTGTIELQTTAGTYKAIRLYIISQTHQFASGRVKTLQFYG